ncbi:MAG TPA: preprotein translocase subunit YajC [Firmicutes bacterium]|nr:preprotein translocase subunit YajC [Bacillota bacterium]
MEFIIMILNMGILFGILWFFMIRPENKRRKALSEMQTSLTKGDRVVTIGGIYGRVHAIEESTITLINDEGAKWIFDRSAIARKVD